MNKVYPNITESIAGIKDGAVIAIPGFFTAGSPRMLIRALIESGVKDLTMACGCGPLLGANEELNALLENGQIKKVIDSYPPGKIDFKGYLLIWQLSR